MATFFQALYFGCLTSNTVNWMEIQEATKKKKKDLWVGLFPSLDGKSACQFLCIKPGIMIIHMFIHCCLAVIIYTLHHISKSTPEYYIIIIKP